MLRQTLPLFLTQPVNGRKPSRKSIVEHSSLSLWSSWSFLITGTILFLLTCPRSFLAWVINLGTVQIFPGISGHLQVMGNGRKENPKWGKTKSQTWFLVPPLPLLLVITSGHRGWLQSGHNHNRNYIKLQALRHGHHQPKRRRRSSAIKCNCTGSAISASSLPLLPSDYCPTYWHANDGH